MSFFLKQAEGFLESVDKRAKDVSKKEWDLTGQRRPQGMIFLLAVRQTLCEALKVHPRPPGLLFLC